MEKRGLLTEDDEATLENIEAEFSRICALKHLSFDTQNDWSEGQKIPNIRFGIISLKARRSAKSKYDYRFSPLFGAQCIKKILPFKILISRLPRLAKPMLVLRGVKVK